MMVPFTNHPSAWPKFERERFYNDLIGKIVFERNAKIEHDGIGIYLLYSFDEVVYVGQGQIFSRIGEHLKSNKQFNSYKYFFMPLDVAKYFELVLIDKYKPKYNIVGNSHKGKYGHIMRSRS